MLRAVLFFSVVVLVSGCGGEEKPPSTSQAEAKIEVAAQPTPTLIPEEGRLFGLGELELKLASKEYPQKEYPLWEVTERSHYQEITYATVRDRNAKPGEIADFIFVLEFLNHQPTVVGIYEKHGEKWELVKGEDKYTNDSATSAKIQ